MTLWLAGRTAPRPSPDLWTSGAQQVPYRLEAGCVGISVASPLARPGGRGAARTLGRSARVPRLAPSRARRELREPRDSVS